MRKFNSSRTGALCVGETMVMLTPQAGSTVADSPSLHVRVGGAESNVAIGLAQRGIPTHWLSRVGQDGFGTRILDELAAHGVGVDLVQTDPHRNTGLYVKAVNAAESAPSVHYYRQGSAASWMDATLLAHASVQDALEEVQLVHFSGITPALSSGCTALAKALLNREEREDAQGRGEYLVSFDINWRPALWADTAPELLRSLADQADVVLVGLDEAEHAFGVRGSAHEVMAALAKMLPGPAVLVIKNDAISALALHRSAGESPGAAELVEVPALSVDVLEPVGAGDAFAAGYLSALLNGRDQKSCLRQGHIHAAMALGTYGDHGELPSEEQMEALQALTDEQWRHLHVHGNTISAGADEAKRGPKVGA